MKNSFKIVGSLVFVCLVFVSVSHAHAYEVKKDGFVYQVKDGCKDIGQRTSGWVDDNGCPISQEDYDKIAKKKSGLQWRNIAILGVALTASAIGASVIVKRNKNTKNRT
jgi:hypothetical protein